MKTPRIDAYTRRGFTLVELLVVITIIAVLVGISVPVYNTVMRNAKKQQANVLCNAIKNAVKGYYSEYSKFPLPAEGTATETTALRTDATIVPALLGTNTQLNPRTIKFLPDLKQVEPGGANGLIVDGEEVSVVDPWGEELYIMMDVDGDTKIENPDSGSASTTLYQDVIVYSSGPDKDPMTWEDNINTWTTKAGSASQKQQDTGK